MALARLVLKNVEKKVGSSLLPPLSLTTDSAQTSAARILAGTRGVTKRPMGTQASEEPKASDDKRVAVKEGGRRRRFNLLPWRNRRRSLWRDTNNDFPPALYEFFPSGLGNALMQATENINRLFNNMNITPFQLSARIKEKDDHYKLRFDVPGLAKEDLKVTVHDGVLFIKGEHKEEQTSDRDDDDDEYLSASSYGYYNTILVLPEDAKLDEIKAELKDGVLTIVIPRTECSKRDIKEVEVR